MGGVAHTARRVTVVGVTLMLVLLWATAYRSDATVATYLSNNSSTYPAGVISLTYDDGPDTYSRAIAEYLHEQHVSATFDVVSDWGHLGTTGFGTPGYENYLKEIVGLGQRLGNHTFNHDELTQDTPEQVRFQVGEDDRYISQYVSNRFFPFTPPYGSYNATVAEDIQAQPSLNRLSGPYYQWGIPGVSGCHYHLPPGSTEECEAPNADDWAYREAGYSPKEYVDDLLAALDAQPAVHGNIYLHDRDEFDIGGKYTLEVTKLLIPALKERHLVFVGLAAKMTGTSYFGRFSEPVWTSDPSYSGTFRTGDVNGDGLTDVCARGPAGIYCSLASIIPSSGLGSSPVITYGPISLWEKTQFTDAEGWKNYPHAATIMLADVNGDGKADIIGKNINGLLLGLSTGKSFKTPKLASHKQAGGSYDFSDGEGWVSDPSYYRTFRAADINGDGKADVCARGPNGIVCATSSGSKFTPMSTLISSEFTDALGWKDVRYASTLLLADVTGDGRADVIAKNLTGLLVAPALSSGTGFGPVALWSAPVGSSYDFSYTEGFWTTSESYWGTFRTGDVNGDGRADVCARTAEGLRCALSTGSSFRQSSIWDEQFDNANGWGYEAPYSVEGVRTLMLGDSGGDGRTDALARNSSGLIADYAP
jgi:peptidoglycan/xylan/chitin deacetylase (PgdA/CDA1 family)